MTSSREQLALEGPSPRMLNLLASFVCGHPVRAHLSRRLESSCLILGKTRTILLDPARATLRDLLVGAILLRSTRRLKPWQEEERVPSDVARVWLREAERELVQLLPGAATLEPGPCEPVVGWDRPKYRALDPAAVARNGIGGGSLQGVELPGVTVEGAENDLRVILEAIADGNYPLEHHSALPGLPIARLPLRIACHEASPQGWERLNEQLRRVEESARSIMRCQMSTWEGATEREPLARRSYGLHLDPARIHEIALSTLEERPPKVFLHPHDVRRNDYDPSGYLTVAAIDFNAFTPTGPDFMGLAKRMAVLLVRLGELMSYDFVVVGASDRIVNLRDGRRAYLHMPVTIKSLDEPMDEGAWNRLSHALELSRATLGTHACFHPLLVEQAVRATHGAAGRYHTHFLQLAATRMLGLEDLDVDMQATRTSNAVDDAFADLRASYPTASLEVFGFVHRQLKSAGRKGGDVERMIVPGL
jgi:hypothetical protein